MTHPTDNSLLSGLRSSGLSRREVGRAAAICLIVGIIALWVLFVTGCGPSERNTGTEKGTAPTSPLTFDEAENIAKFAALMVGGTWSHIQPTGSMEPLINSRSVVVYRPYDGNLASGMIVAFDRDRNGTLTLHTVTHVRGDHFIATGIANDRSDGWQPRSAIQHVLVGIIYAGGES
jgi:hypothetical protein